jgi:hypothetical protein
VREIHIDKGRVGEESKGKETDGCPLTDDSPHTKSRRLFIVVIIVILSITARP